MLRLVSLFSPFFVLVLFASGARAAVHDATFNICNHSGQSLNYIIAYDGPDNAANGLTTEGYWNVSNGSCTDITRSVVTNTAFAYAVDNAFAHQVDIAGTTALCVSAGLPNGFKIPNAGTVACNGDDQWQVKFKPIPTFVSNRASFDVLAADRTLHRKTLTICNDTTMIIQVAGAAQDQGLGLALIGRGWYTIDSGSCMTLFATDGNDAYYYADSATIVWDGDTKLCTQDDGDFLFTHLGTMDCTANGRRAYGFRTINLPFAGVNILTLTYDEATGQRGERVTAAPLLR